MPATIVDLVRSGALCAKFQRFDLVLDDGSAKTYDLRPTLKEAGIHWNVNTGTWRKQVTSKERAAVETARTEALSRARKAAEADKAQHDALCLHIERSVHKHVDALAQRCWVGMRCVRTTPTTALHLLGSDESVDRWISFHDAGVGMYPKTP